MEINWFLTGIVAICALILIIFLIKRNLKDKKDLEVFLNKTDNEIKKDESEVNDNE